MDETAQVAENVEIGAGAIIGKNCVIESGVKIFPNATVYENVKIGKNSTIHSGVAIRENCQIGANCIVHNNCVIGSDGFGYAKDRRKTLAENSANRQRSYRRRRRNRCEILAIDCASVGETRIKRGAKIDNLVQIGHSCTIEEDALVCAQTGLAGSSVIGKRVILAGQVGIAGHLKVGDDAIITAKSATSHDVENGKTISGIPAFDNRDWLRSIAAFRRLGEMARSIRDFEKRIVELEEKQM
ncbi:MAG: UDP-3-O-(3-hydroxymyristoyl)glucosamine N-acyltransferase [Pyrinomonadaceae bacterium]